MNEKVLLLIVMLFSGNILFAQSPDPNFHIYLLMGQSNMAGRGKITDEFKNIQHVNLQMLDSNYKWVQAKHPLHFDKPKVAGVGPGLSFGIAMAQNSPSVKIGLVPCAVGGTSINKWSPGVYDKATNTYPYDDAVKRIREAMKYGVVKGVIWHQGGADRNHADTYLEKLTTFINRIRTLVNNPQLPFVAGELGIFKLQSENININNVLKELPQSVTNTAVASSEGLKDKGDATHFDSSSADELGKRFAEKMIALQAEQQSNIKKTKK